LERKFANAPITFANAPIAFANAPIAFANAPIRQEVAVVGSLRNAGGIKRSWPGYQGVASHRQIAAHRTAIGWAGCLASAFDAHDSMFAAPFFASCFEPSDNAEP